MSTVRAETLRRAAEIIGEDKLAEELGVSSELLAEWKATQKSVPDEVFLKCVDIVVSDKIRSQSRPDSEKPH